MQGEVTRPLEFGVDDLHAMNQYGFAAKDRDGTIRNFTGVMLADILDSAGVPLDARLMGRYLTQHVIVKAFDGYEVVFSLPEIDPEFTDDMVLLATGVDGQPLPQGEGPFRVIVAADKKHARWIREVSTIRVVLSTQSGLVFDEGSHRSDRVVIKQLDNFII